ncbi:mediator of RNA polymerase II transcription subunit 4 [Diutina catenulata]
MLPKKDKSVPVSRVGSSTRLPQLARSPTPSAGYVSSSLNPQAAAGPRPASALVGGTPPAPSGFQKLPIVEDIAKFESTLKQLSAKVGSFDDDGLDTLVGQLVDINDDLRAKTIDLEKHRTLGREISELESQGSKYDARFKHILQELIDCRASLKQLPRGSSETQALLEAAEKEPPRRAGSVADGLITHPPDMAEVLQYAMKLAKFTKAPPTMANLQYQIHPNNYVWPAEDALRRGMLAASSLNPSEVINDELGVTEEPEQNQTEEAKPEEEKQPEKQRKGSFGYGSASGAPPTEENKEDDDMGLDLFDPEDDFSD